MAEHGWMQALPPAGLAALVFVAVFAAVQAVAGAASPLLLALQRRVRRRSGLDELTGTPATIGSLGLPFLPLLGVALGAVIFANAVAIGLGLALGVLAARTLLRWLVERQHARLEGQLPSAIDQLVQLIRGQVGLEQAVEDLALSLEPPIAGVFRAVQDRRAALAVMDQAFDDIAQQQRSDNIRLLLSALAVFHRQGGNSIPALQSMSEAFREILRLSEKLRTASAEARASFRLTNLMGAFILLVVGASQPELLAEFSNTRVGGIGFALAIVIWLIGARKMRALMQVRI